MITIETVCLRGHVEHVTRPSGGHVGTALTFCQRVFKDGGVCESPIINTFVLPTDIGPIGVTCGCGRTPVHSTVDPIFHPGCGIAEPHGPGIHPPAVDLTEPDEEDGEENGCWHYDYERFCTQCDPASYEPEEDDEEDLEPAATVADRARAFLLRNPALVAAAALASLGLTIYFWATGHKLLALLV